MLLQRMRRPFWLGLLLVGVLAATGVSMAMEVGEQAPDFTLPSTLGGKVSLSQFRGKKLVLLEFHVND
jgi:hypothetical protein